MSGSHESFSAAAYAQIRQGGCIDSYNQSLALTLMCLSAEDVSRLRTGPLTEHSIGAPMAMTFYAAYPTCLNGRV